MACFTTNKSIRRTGGFLAVLAMCALTRIEAAEDASTDQANKAKNLARINCGARIGYISDRGTREFKLSGNKGANDLLLDDNTLSCDMPKGDHTFLITLANISNLDRFAFINENPNMSGTLQIFVSNYRLGPNENNWVPTGGRFHF